MKRLLALCLCATLVASLASSAAATEQTLSHSAVDYAAVTVEPENIATALHFEDLRTTVLKYNYTVAYLNACISDVGEVDSDDLYDAVAGLESLVSAMEAQQVTFISPPTIGLYGTTSESDSVSISGLDTLNESIATIYASMFTMMQADIVNLNTTIASYESQAKTLDNTIATTKNTLNNSINQLVKATETLYIGIVTMENVIDDFDRNIATMERAVALFQAQYDRGLISLFELETMEYQLRQLESAKETMEFQIITTKMTLEGMVGMARTGVLELYPLTMPTQEELETVDYDSNLNKAMNQNVEYMNAESDYYANSGDGTYKRALVVAVDDFQANFYLTCITVPEMSRLVAVAEDTVAYQNRALEIAAKSYELGMSSDEEYLTALDSVAAAESDLFKAELNLFTEYRDYIWAMTYGIV